MALPKPKSDSSDAVRQRVGRYRLEGTGSLFSTTLVLPRAELEKLRRLHARLQLALVSLGSKGAWFSQASTVRLGVRYLVECCGRDGKMRSTLIESAKRLQACTSRIGAPGERINVFLLREDLPELLKLQAQIMSEKIDSSRSLVVRCAIDLLDKAMRKSASRGQVVQLAKAMLESAWAGKKEPRPNTFCL
jgi:hypothetical protein